MRIWFKKDLINYIYNLKNKLTFKDLDLKIKKKESPLIDLKKINFSNYGYNKNIVTGELFDKKFKITISDSYNKINFQLFKTGILQTLFSMKLKNSLISGFVEI